jgi:DNA-binding NarL/FixJ family response regulator
VVPSREGNRDQVVIDREINVGSKGPVHGDDSDGKGRVTIVVAEDDSRRRTSVCRGLEHHGFAVVAEAGDAESAVAVAFEYRPRVCLLDVDIPGDGIAAADQIATLLPGTKIAMLADTATEADVLRAIQAGADGYLLRSTAPDRMSAALKGVLGGEAALPRALTGMLVESVRTSNALAGPRRRRGMRLSFSLMFAPRFSRHLLHRLREGFSPSQAWRSSRRRMVDYL